MNPTKGFLGIFKKKIAISWGKKISSRKIQIVCSYRSAKVEAPKLLPLPRLVAIDALGLMPLPRLAEIETILLMPLLGVSIELDALK